MTKQYAIRTPNNKNFLTIVNGGGMNAAKGVAISTANKVNNPPTVNEIFKLICVDINTNQYALKTSGKYFVSFVDGGGVSGPNSTSSPVHTDETEIGVYGKLTLEPVRSNDGCHRDGLYALVTEKGYYVNAVDGGGISGNQATAKPAVATNATQISENEIFSLQDIVQVDINREDCCVDWHLNPHDKKLYWSGLYKYLIKSINIDFDNPETEKDKAFLINVHLPTGWEFTRTPVVINGVPKTNRQIRRYGLSYKRSRKDLSKLQLCFKYYKDIAMIEQQFQFEAAGSGKPIISTDPGISVKKKEG